MAQRNQPLDVRLAALADGAGAMRSRSGPAVSRAIDRFIADCEAAKFHLTRRDGQPIVLCLLGGTGTGKSTLLNRLLGITSGQSDLSATSFRRTFTAGPVAAAADPKMLPPRWLGVEPQLVSPIDLPARGQPDALMLVQYDSELTRRAVIVDTPDLDGDQPVHHAQADRAFRWADAVLFLVTPEKYQMTELLPYYRLAARYGIPATFVMNKAEEQNVIDDYTNQLRQRGDLAGTENASVFAVPRDDAGYEPPHITSLTALRSRLLWLQLPGASARHHGNTARVGDLLGRLRDQIMAPSRDARKSVARLIAILAALDSPTTDIDVNPLTQALQRRLQQRSVLYLMGPGRIVDRVKQVPMLLARLPRSTWDMIRGKPAANGTVDQAEFTANPLDFHAALLDQFAAVQSRVDDVLHSDPIAATWMDDPAFAYAGSKLPAADAGRIADEELAELKKWMTGRWNATPRDTALIKKLFKVLPGGEKLTAWSEAAPYLVLLVSIATSHITFGVDTAAGVLISAWLGHKLSDEVAAHARNTNRRIAERFANLAHQQIRKTSEWLDQRAPAEYSLDTLEEQAEAMSATLAGLK